MIVDLARRSGSMSDPSQEVRLDRDEITDEFNAKVGQFKTKVGRNTEYTWKMLRCAMDENLEMIVYALRDERERFDALSSGM